MRVMKVDQEMALDFSGAALREMAEGAETHAKILRRFGSRPNSGITAEVLKPFDDLAAACRAMIALQERKG